MQEVLDTWRGVASHYDELNEAWQQIEKELGLFRKRNTKVNEYLENGWHQETADHADVMSDLRRQAQAVVGPVEAKHAVKLPVNVIQKSEYFDKALERKVS